jgi:hypothetical protein
MLTILLLSRVVILACAWHSCIWEQDAGRKLRRRVCSRHEQGAGGGIIPWHSVQAGRHGLRVPFCGSLFFPRHSTVGYSYSLGVLRDCFSISLVKTLINCNASAWHAGEPQGVIACRTSSTERAQHKPSPGLSFKHNGIPGLKEPRRRPGGSA